ncbi:TUS1 [Sanghuangporus vaninii]
MGDDLGDFIDQYRDEAIRPDPPSYEPSRRDGASVSPSLPEKNEGVSFTAPKSPPSGRAARPLPRPPGVNGSTSSFGSTSPGIPEPHPYVHPSTSQQTDSYQRLSTGSANSLPRRLPVAPESGIPTYTTESNLDRTLSSGSTEGSRSYGLPLHPRLSRPPPPPSSSSYASSSSATSSRHPYTTATPITDSPSSQLASSGWSNASDTRNSSTNGYGFLTTLSRTDSSRPKGALAPAVPGQSSVSLNGSLPFAPSAGSSADIYASPRTGAYPSSSPPGVGSSSNEGSSTRPEVNLIPSASSDDVQLRSPSSSMVATNNASSSSSMLEVQPVSSSAKLGRSTSTSSATSSFQSGSGLAASSTSATSPTPVYSNGSQTTTAGPSNYKVHAGINRGGSLSSFKSMGSGGSMTSRYDDAPYDVYRQAAGSSRIDRFVERNQRDRVIDDIKRQLALHEGYESEEDYDEEEEDRFVNLALLSHVAVRLRDKVPRGTHVKGGIPYQRAFTGRDIVSTIQAQIQRELVNMHVPSSDRRLALSLARSLQNQLFFYEVEWGGRVLQDSVEDVYMFLDDQDGGSDLRNQEMGELPTGVFTPLTKCYLPSCMEGTPYACSSYSCPRRRGLVRETTFLPETSKEPKRKDWAELIDKSILKSLPESEKNRQTIIHKVIEKEELYVQDLDLIENLFMKPLRMADPPIIPPSQIDSFMIDVFHNILDIRDVNRRLLEVLEVRQREQSPIIQRIGDVFLTAATDFRNVYADYVGNLPVAEKRLKDEMDSNPELRRFLERCSRAQESRRLDLKHFLQRPSEQLQKYPVVLEAIFNETEEGNPDADFLAEAIQAIKQLHSVAQLRTFQAAMGKGPTANIEYSALVPDEVKNSMSKQELKRQATIFEFIQGEMMYVKDLEAIGTMYVQPLKNAEPPIIPHERLSTFLQDAFHNYAELYHIHRHLLSSLHEIQRDEHPIIRSINAPVLDAALNFRDAYMAYIPNNPIAHYRIDEEMQNNPVFKAFADATVKHPDSRRLDMKSFVHRPVARLARYELLLTSILKETPPNHEDRETIPQTMEVLRSLLKETNTGVKSANERVEIWRYNQNLVFKPGEAIDMDLLDENRSLIYTGKLLRQPDTGFEWSGWTELFVLLFDNYLVMTKPKEKDGITKYHVNRRPIPLDLLNLVNFTDPPTQRSKGILGGLRGGDRSGGPGQEVIVANGTPSENDARWVFPCTIHHNGRLGGLWTVYAETAQARSEWKQKLDEALVLRKVVTDANKVFEIETLSSETFCVPSMHATQTSASWNEEHVFTGKVTCSVPFSTPDGRGLVAIGCAEGVWIGLRHDPKSLRRVLHLKMVTQCAMLEDFGIFLVLADKALFAYHIEALVPSSPPTGNTSRTPQKLNGNKDVQFFTVGTLGGRTLVIYMKKKGMDSVFRVLEPVIGKINEKSKAVGGFSRFGFGSQRSDWFRIFRDFFLPSESYDLIFLKAKIAILCSKGFEIMDLTDFKSVTIPQRDDPRLAALTKRCESCKPIGMFRSSENEFLLCYDEFGLYVDRHGDPSRSVGTIEWEGTAERVAWHPPYVLLFDTRFIEIRHVETGRLAQIIPGNDIRCIWDGRGSNVPPVGTPGPDGWTDTGPQEARIHAVMQAPETTGNGARPSRAVAQHVFQLVPTIPLYLPGSLSSPSHSQYFPQSTSPPTSPSLTPRHSWR